MYYKNVKYFQHFFILIKTFCMSFSWTWTFDCSTQYRWTQVLLSSQYKQSLTHTHTHTHTSLTHSLTRSVCAQFKHRDPVRGRERAEVCVSSPPLYLRSSSLSDDRLNAQWKPQDECVPVCVCRSPSESLIQHAVTSGKLALQERKRQNEVRLTLLLIT